MTRRFPCRAFGAFTTIAITVTIGACGGAVEPSDESSSPPPAATLSSATGQIAPTGAWELVSLERSGRSIATTVHDVLQMEIREDGGVTVRRCGKTSYEPGSVSVRCADASSYDCFYGTVRTDGASWRIDVPSLPTTHEDQGLIAYEGDGIKVLYVVPTAEAGHFIRVTESEARSSTSSSTVGNCKGG